MESNLKGKDFITTQDWSVEELEQIFTLAAELKQAKREGKPTPLLAAKTLYMIFFDASTRTRNSFETGMTQLGGHGIFLSPDKMQISHGENARDTANVLSRYGDGIAIRHCAFREGNDYLNEVAREASIPVLSMQDDVYHPCQILADYLTIREKFGKTKGLKIGVAWTSAPNYVRPLSVPQSLILMMPRFGLDVTLAVPPEFRLMPEIEETAAAERGRGRRQIRDHQPLRGRLRRCRRGGAQVVGPAHAHHRPRRGARPHREVPDVALRKRAHGARQGSPHLHAPAARRPRPRGHRRGHRRPAVRRLRRGRKPAPRPEGAHGADDGLKGLGVRS